MQPLAIYLRLPSLKTLLSKLAVKQHWTMVASILNAVVQILIWERLMRSQVLMLQPSVICVDGCQLISAEGL